MDEITLGTVLLNDPFCRDVFKGTYPSNELLQPTFTFPACYIINTDKNYAKGAHWFVLYLENRSCDNARIQAQIFDSLGPDVNRISQTLKISLYGMKISKNMLRYQAFNSNSCGLFCLYYIKLRCRGLDDKAVLNTLRIDDFERNELIIRDFVKLPYT